MPKIFCMKNSSELFFGLSFIVTLFMTVLAWFSYKEHHEKELAHHCEFWVSTVFYVVIMYIFRNESDGMAAMIMIGWIWPLRTFRAVLEDLSQATLARRWHLFLLVSGAFTTFALGGYQFPFVAFTIPFSLSVGIVGFMVLFQALRNTDKNLLTVLHVTSYSLFALFFLNRLSFPFWRLSPVSDYGFYSELVFLIGFAGAGLAAQVQLLRTRHEHVITKILKERSDKFVGQSKYSELGMMAAGIAHEINNPLAVIQARTSQLLRIYRNPGKEKELGDGLQQILYTSERINRTIQGIREFVHQDERAPWQDIPLKELIDDVLVFTGQRMKNHGVNLRFYGLDNFSVTGNKIQLEQIILNLLNNSFDAIEYLPDKWIEVSCHQHGTRIQLYFKDSGKGIPQEISEHMMEPFYSTKDIGKGTGLGLALARGIAEQHGGHLKYLGHCPHTTFLLELPKASEHEWNLPLH